MSTYIVLGLSTRRREDALKIYERANELLKELNTEESKKIKFDFEDPSPDGEYGFCFDSYNGDLCGIAFDIITDVVASFPEMMLHFVECGEGPVTTEGFSENGKLFEMDAPKDENGRYLLDDGESVVYIYPLELLTEALNESRYTTYNLCHRLLWLKVNTPDDAKSYVLEEPSNGQSVNVGDIARKLFGDIKEAHAEKSDGGADFPAMENQTRQWMNEGAENICKASFMYKGNYCTVDILRKNGDRWDIYKVQPEFAEGETNPEVFAPSLAYQKWVLTQCGVKVGYAYLIGEQQGKSDLQRHVIDMNALVETEYPKVGKQVWLALHYLRNRRYGPFNELPDPCEEGCPFMEYCKQNVKRRSYQTAEDYVPSPKKYDEDDDLPF
jgi:hypothetical protein